MTDADADDGNMHAAEQHPESRTGSGLVVIALILPVIAGIVLLFVTSVGLAFGVSIATVVTSAALVAVDASRLGKVDRHGNTRESPGLLFVGMCLMWIVVYPLAFFRRRSFAGPRLGFVSLIVAIFFAGCPLVGSLLIPPRLPACTSQEVTKLLDQVLRSTPVGADLRSIDGHRELSYDRDANIRHGACVAHTGAGDISIQFTVEWLDRGNRLFQVRIPPADLPPCNGPEVVKLLEQVVRSTLVAAELNAIDGHRELRHDQVADVRHGECVAHTSAGDIPVRFVVEWQDHSKGLFQVRVPPPDLPACTGPEVAKLLEQVIRSTLVGATLTSISGHRELQFDREANVRHGECLAHTDAGEIPVRFVVEWQDRSKGRYQVRTVEFTD